MWNLECWLLDLEPGIEKGAVPAAGRKKGELRK